MSIQPNSFSIKFLLLSLLIPSVFLIFGFCTLEDYGETFDEYSVVTRGEAYFYGYPEKGLAAIEELPIVYRAYGPVFSYLVVASNHWLNKELGWISNQRVAYHLPALLATTLSIWLVFLFAHSLWGLVPAFLSTASLALMPRLIGHSQSNLKDIPTMFFYLATCFILYFAFQKKNKLLYILGGIFLGLTYSTRILALTLIPLVILWFLISNLPLSKLRWKSVLSFVGSLALVLGIGFCSVLFFWPYYRDNPIEHFIETPKVLGENSWNWPVLYLGEYYPALELPWHYPAVMFATTTPIVILASFLIGAIFAIFSIFRNQVHKSSLAFLILWILLPPTLHLISGAAMHDGIRHWLLILPPIALLSGYALWRIGEAIKHEKIKAGYLAVVTLPLLHLLFVNFQSHPYQITYFNSFLGGVKGAHGLFDIDNWGHSLKETGEWMNQTLPKKDAPPIRVHAPLGGYLLGLDETKFQFVGDEEFPEYQVELQKAHLLGLDSSSFYKDLDTTRPVYSLAHQGVDLTKVYELEENSIPRGSFQLTPVTRIPTPKWEHGLLESHFDQVGFDEEATSTDSGSIPFHAAGLNSSEEFAVRYEGYLQVPDSGKRCIALQSAGPARLEISDTTLAIKDCCLIETVLVDFEPGYHKFSIEYRNMGNLGMLMLSWAKNECTKLTRIEKSFFWHDPSTNESEENS